MAHLKGTQCGCRGPAATYDSDMVLREELLSDETLDEVVAFFRRSNPFAERVCGWDTGRFIDWRWGTNAVRAVDDPDWFSRHCRIFRDGVEIRAVAVAEYGRDAEFIITPAEDPAAADHVLARLIELHHVRGTGMSFEVSADEEWLCNIFARAGLTEEKMTGHEWEYDLSSLPEPSPVADGFTVATLEQTSTPGEKAAVYAGISGCIAKAFDHDFDFVPTLLSLATNPMFRPELSVVARSPDGRIAAYCRGTVDPDNGVCGIDPVCTHPDFQRLGLGKAVVQRCFANQRELGGRFSYIGSAPEPAPGTHLYRSLGPKSRAVNSTWTM